MLLFCVSCASVSERRGPPTVDTLRCEYLDNPIGIDMVRPRLSWLPGQRQAAYQLLVASSKELLAADNGDLWDSCQVHSSQSTQIEYVGKPLASHLRCFWKVRVWDKDRIVSEWSKAAEWTMGLLDKNDWKAQWIGAEKTDVTKVTNAVPTPARYLRRDFSVGEGLRRATVSISGLGLFELQINGHKIGKHVLEPALSQYNKRIFYVTFDVLKQLHAGSNSVGIILGNGRYYPLRIWAATPLYLTGYPKALFQLDLEYAGGSVAQVVSDGSWKITTNGPIRANNEYDGEECDARMELDGWSQPGFDDSAWQTAHVVSAGSAQLSAQMSHPIEIVQTIHPQAILHSAAGVYIYDMGQNMVGWCRLQVSGPRGTRVQLRHAEILDTNGLLYVDNLRTAKASDTYVLKGRDLEVYAPRFTYHGFRYVEVTGFPGEPGLTNLEGEVVRDALPHAGDFECSNPLLNRIYHNIYWGTQDNYRSIPTDCPQRDERQGWLGDRSEEALGESYMFDVAAFYNQWIDDIRDTQRANGSVPDVAPSYFTLYNDGVTWPSSYIIIPQMLYDQYGDLRALQTHYVAMKTWTDYMAGFLDHGIMPTNTYADWCVPPESPTLIESRDPKRKTDGPLISTAYFYHDLCLMARTAMLLRKPSDERQFRKLAGQVRAAFQSKYFHSADACYDNGTQTSSVLPLAFDMVPKKYKTVVMSHFVKKIEVDSQRHVGTGLIGGQHLMRALSENGRFDLAYALATQTTYPSWGYMVSKGATTIWELWNGDTADPAMNSGNHVMLIGDLNIWLHEYLLGIRPDPAAPGFAKFIICPEPVGDLKWVKGNHQSMHGKIDCQWWLEKGRFELTATVPPNTTATVYLPASNHSDVTESGRTVRQNHRIKFLGWKAGRAVCEIQSGHYDFCSTFDSSSVERSCHEQTKP